MIVVTDNCNKTVYGSFVTLAFRVRSNFDDLVIEDGELSFYLNGDIIVPIKKNAGYYVITNVKDKVFNLKISSCKYFEKTLNINLDDIKEKDKCIEIFLIPNYKYLIPKNSYQIKGIVDPDTFILLTKFHSRTNLRYQGFNKNSNTISIANPTGESLNGRMLAIVDCDNNKFEVIFIKGKISNSEYLIDVKISNKVKNYLPIQKAYIYKSDERGIFNLYIKESDFPDEEYILSFYKKGKLTYKVFSFKGLKCVDLQANILKEKEK